MRPSNLLVLAGVSLALAGCNNADPNRTTSVPPGVNNPTAIVAPITTPSAPPAPAERTPVAPNANTMAPGTNATIAFADANEQFAGASLPSKGGAPKSQAQAVDAQQQAAQAPDTAAADKAKEQAMSGGNGTRMPGTARDTSANSPRHGTLTPQEESTQMPKAGQVNNYSSPALEKDSGRSSEGDDAAKSQPPKSQ
ncbi:MAG TPA: hypothetical protein VF304_08600 [Casimicrobiaceae bacterium]